MYIEDKKGTAWHFLVTGATMRRIQSVAGDKNPVEIATGAWMDAAFGMKVLYQICKPQADAKKMEEDEFLDQFESYGNIPEAIAEALENFFPQYVEIFKMIREHIPKMMEAAAEDLKTDIQGQLASGKNSGRSFTRSPVSVD